MTKPKSTAPATREAVSATPMREASEEDADQEKEDEEENSVGEQSDGARSSAPARGGPEGKADQIRKRFPQVLLVSLTIPAAYNSLEDVLTYVTDAQSLDGYAYDINYPQWALANPNLIQSFWATIRTANPQLSGLPETFSDANDTTKKKIYKAVAAVPANYLQIKSAMWSDPTWKVVCATSALNNNRAIPNATTNFAKAQGAIDGASGDIRIGGSMISQKPADIAALVNATSSNVAALLAANSPVDGRTPDQAAKDSVTSKIRFLTISAHGWPTGMGGHGRADEADFSKRMVAGIVGGMSGVLTNDVRVRLFACSTARLSATDSKGEGSLADKFRDELLAKDKTDAAVIGHTENGNSQANPTPRFFHGDADGKKYNDWRAAQVFDTNFVQKFLKDIAAPQTAANLEKIRKEMSRFFSRECWMEDISSLEALKESSRKRWLDRFGSYDSVKNILADKKKRSK